MKRLVVCTLVAMLTLLAVSCAGAGPPDRANIVANSIKTAEHYESAAARIDSVATLMDMYLLDDVSIIIERATNDMTSASRYIIRNTEILKSGNITITPSPASDSALVYSTSALGSMIAAGEANDLVVVYLTDGNLDMASYYARQQVKNVRAAAHAFRMCAFFWSKIKIN